MKIMIVDDHQGVRSLIRQVLAGPNDVVHEVDNAEEAVRVATDFCPDCVTMDVRMPGMCAFAATRAIREVNADACVVVVTSYDQSDLRKAAFDAGASAYVVKDDLAMLSSIVSSVLSPGDI